MEKIINDLTIFEKYSNRQVVLNYYEDHDCLIHRDGFFFHSIKLLSSSLLFSKKDGSSFPVPITDQSRLYKNNQFPHYYILRNNTDCLEIYFPG